MRNFGIRCAVMAALGVAMVVAISSSGNVTAANADDKEKEKVKFTISEVMQQAHKSGLWKKVAAGTADKADREKLAELYKALAQGKPPKGELDEWKKTTEVMLKIAEEAIKDPDAGKQLKVNCGQCHGKFKG
jgi:Na+-translocating ferredoxin:NAD+ oxidoreductase RnfG subunit